MNEQITKIIKSLSGTVLTIGIGSSYDYVIENNKAIKESYVLEKIGRKIKGQDKGLYNNKKKNINLNKLKKIFKYKKIDFVLCDYEVIKGYLRHFIRNSIYITRKDIYFVGDAKTTSIDELAYRYNRYGIKTNIECDNNLFIFKAIINDNNTIWYKSIVYYFRDLGYDILELIGDVMAS